MSNHLILGIETSCDETSAAVVRNGREVVSNIISSQIAIHEKYGGVVPEIASRKHIESISQVVQAALHEAGVMREELSAIAITQGPGLVGALLVGLSYAKAFAYAINKPLVGVHHIEGHICSNYLETDFAPPYICLVVSGGHTIVVRVSEYGRITKEDVLGSTKDDAAGEAFDKIARALGLGYPGGPKIEALAKTGNPNAIGFPRALLAEGNYDFSFSGLKSAVLNYLNAKEMKSEEVNKADVAASFQKAVVDVLVDKTIGACKAYGLKKIALAGGVCCNNALRLAMKEACEQNNFALQIPPPIYCTDNAAMVACRGYYKFINGERAGLDINAHPSLPLWESL